MTSKNKSEEELMEGKEHSNLAVTVKHSTSGGTLPSWATSFIAGGIAGTCAKSAIAPLERVKILFQIRHKLYPYSGVFSTINSIFKKEGTFGLWKGNTATVVRIFPYAAIQFLSFETYRKKILGDSKRLGSGANILAGSMAGATSVIFTYPLDLVRVQLAADTTKKRFNGIFHCIYSIGTQQGITGLYRGMSPTLMGIVPYAGVNFGSYELLKSVVSKYSDREQLNIPIRLLCGGLAGAIGQTATYPLDVVRRQMQTSGFEEGHGNIHKNTWEAMKTIVKTEGWLGLYKGLSINYLRVGPQVAISFATYETVKKFLEER